MTNRYGEGLLRASSYEPRSRDLASPPNPLLNFRCVHMRGRAGSVPEISITGLEILPHERFIPVTGMNGVMNSGGSCGIVLHCCCIFHIISIPFNGSDTALRVTDAKISPKVKIFLFRYVCFVSQIWRQNSYPGSFTFSRLGNRAEISHMNPRQNSSR